MGIYGLISEETGELIHKVIEIEGGTNKTRNRKKMESFIDNYPDCHIIVLGTNWTSEDEEKRMIKLARRLIRSSGRKYCGITERGKGGRLHCHILVSGGFWGFEVLKPLWASATGIENPHVFIQELKNSDGRAIKYLLKYVTKEKGRFFSSRGLGKLVGIGKERKVFVEIGK